MQLRSRCSPHLRRRGRRVCSAVARRRRTAHRGEDRQQQQQQQGRSRWHLHRRRRLLPRDVLRALVRYRCTGLAAVPPLWNQLVQLDWPEEIAGTLRYVTNTGGAMPVATTRRLQALLPSTDIFLMYGLTEAFRSTYLPPSELD